MLPHQWGFRGTCWGFQASSWPSGWPCNFSETWGHGCLVSSSQAQLWACEHRAGVEVDLTLAVLGLVKTVKVMTTMEKEGQPTLSGTSK